MPRTIGPRCVHSDLPKTEARSYPKGTYKMKINEHDFQIMLPTDVILREAMLLGCRCSDCAWLWAAALTRLLDWRTVRFSYR